ncbi:MAG: hypothetical protein JNL25_17815 [Rhodospirillaceae bacterium]|nr:hypothetical protein [Rhodospirillaceae bacterium]
MASAIRLPIWLILATTFGGLATLAIVVVAWGINRIAIDNTTTLLNNIAGREILALEESLRSELDPALQEVTFLARYMADGKVDAADDQRLGDLLIGSLAASPQINAVTFIRPDLQTVVAARDVEGQPYFSGIVDGLRDAALRQALQAGMTAKVPKWGAPIYVPEFGHPLMSALAPVWDGSDLRGVFTAVVSLPAISQRLETRLVNQQAVAFALLADGRVFAHPRLVHRGLSYSTTQPLPRFDAVDDPVLAQLDLGKSVRADALRNGATDFQEQEVAVGETRHLLIFKDSLNLIGVPLTVGVHVPFAEVEQVFVALEKALYGALIVIAVAILLALLLGLLIGRPMRALADATSHLAALSFADAPTLRHSRFAEIDIAADAYNRMRSGLGWFSTYVPRQLVPLLMRPDSDETLASREVEVTVLFTDIVGFSGIAQRLSARRLAAFLNRHFTLLGRHIEAEGGSIDKYIGDSIMAFWGAPEAQADHAARAARAALAIAEHLAADNARRARKGLKPVRIRIGIHSGRAIAGNIGAAGRINYTLVGDTVNIAQRLEQFGKRVDDGKRAAVISLSADTADLLPDDVPIALLGDEVLSGQAMPIKVYRLGNGD